MPEPARSKPSSPDRGALPTHHPHAKLSAELEASLIRALMQEWHDLNREHFHEALRPPVLALMDSRTILGRWHAHRRLLEISRPLVQERSWSDVIEVLEHEIAHQFAHQVLGATDEKAHGPAFQKICARMGISAQASSEVGRDVKESQILARVRDLLALAESPNRHEAQNAAAAAQRLMLKHNIAISEKPGRRHYAYRHLGAPNGRIQESEYRVASILGRFFFVEVIWVPAYRPHDGKRGSVLEICGTPENLEMAGFVHAFLLCTSETLWKEHKRRHGIRLNRDRRDFLAGVMEGFSERLAHENTRSKERGMVWVRDADLQSFYDTRHPRTRNVQSYGLTRGTARLHGQAAGRNIVLRRGITTGPQQQRRLALPAKPQS